ncbi:MAG: hypothetical protein IT320_27845 [Anaerolineae bacterium]|nr:hypothetical protein [Anaerolineae bacterium]
MSGKWSHTIQTRLRQLLEPRASDRDEAFRERIIRSSTVILIVLGTASFFSTIFIYKSEWGLISFPSVHLVALALCLGSFLCVENGKRMCAGWLLALAPLMGASGIVMLSRDIGIASGVFLGFATFALAPLIATLVLPRSSIYPVSVVAAILYGVSQFIVEIGDLQLIGVEPWSMFISVLMLLLVEGTLLRQLRVEFDSRLVAMSESLRQTEQAKEQAEAARVRAEQADKAKSQFLANMSHELRTPLNAIIGYDEAMIAGMAGNFTPKQIDLLKQIQRNSRRLLGLINDVLDLAKVESGTLQAVLEPMEPHVVINEIVDSVRALADERGIQILLDISEDMPEFIISDSRKLEQILVNLLSNAIKFTEAGHVAVAAELDGDEYWTLKVSDTGIGMAQDVLTYVFEPFRQVDGTNTRKYKGTGLGLAITKRLVECLEGTITVDSELGKGSVFTVRLPTMPIPQHRKTQTLTMVKLDIR